jgi:hypothetical protein
MGTYTPVPTHGARGFAIEVHFEGCAPALEARVFVLFTLYC